MPDRGPRLWYEGVDALNTREQREGPSVSCGALSPGAAAVGTVRCFARVLDRIQLTLQSVEAGHSTLVELCTEVH